MDQENEIKKNYIDSLIEFLESDKKSVLLYVAFDFALIVTAVSDLYPSIEKIPPSVVFSLIFLFLSAYFFFMYYRALHLTRLKVTHTIINLDITKARGLITDKKKGIWAKNSWKYVIAYIFLIIGVCVYISPIIKRLLKQFLPLTSA